MSEAPKIFDRALRARRLERASTGARRAEFLRERVAEDLAERVSAISRTFAVAADLGAGDGAFRRCVTKTAPGKIGWLAESDLAVRAGAHRIVADEERPPFAPASLDLIVSGLALHWVNDLVGALVQIRRVLRPDGLFMGALFGGATLTELRQSLTEAEATVRGGAGPRVSPFIDPPDGATLLQRAGFALPVVDTDKVTVLYDHPLKLFADLRAMGETNILVDRPHEPLSRPILAEMSRLYAARFAEANGKIRATFEIVTLTGWAPHPEQPEPLARGSAKMRLGDALRGGQAQSG